MPSQLPVFKPKNNKYNFRYKCYDISFIIIIHYHYLYIPKSHVLPHATHIDLQ